MAEGTERPKKGSQEEMMRVRGRDRSEVTEEELADFSRPGELLLVSD